MLPVRRGSLTLARQRRGQSVVDAIADQTDPAAAAATPAASVTKTGGGNLIVWCQYLHRRDDRQRLSPLQDPRHGSATSINAGAKRPARDRGRPRHHRALGVFAPATVVRSHDCDPA
jgi:hypothetical protein